MPKPRGSGDLRQRVKFQRRVEKADGYGNTVDVWEDMGIERAASLTPTSGGEEVQAARVAGVSRWECWTRYDATVVGVTTEDRLIDVRSGRSFNIRFAEDLEGRRTWLLFQLEAGKADG